MMKSLEKKKQEIQLSFDEHKLAKDNPRMRDVDVLDIRKALTYTMNLIGIKGEQVPSLEQKQLITDFLQNDMGRFTCEQLVMAFKMMASGKIAKVEHYGTFNALYISEVLRSYDVYLAREKILLEKEQPKKEPTQDEKNKIHNDFITRLIDDLNKCKEAKDCLIADDMNVVYNFLIDSGIYQPSSELRTKQYQIERERISTTTQKGELSRDKWNVLDAFRDGSKDKTNVFHQKAIGDAKRSLLKQWVMNCIEIDYDFEAELNSIKK